MAPQPKKKHSKGRTQRRRGNIKLEIPNLVVCKNCGKKKQPHQVCKNCGSKK